MQPPDNRPRAGIGPPRSGYGDSESKSQTRSCVGQPQTAVLLVQVEQAVADPTRTGWLLTGQATRD